MTTEHHVWMDDRQDYYEFMYHSDEYSFRTSHDEKKTRQDDSNHHGDYDGMRK